MSEWDSTKSCSTCDTIKPLSAFNRHNKTSSGLRDQCRECQSEYNRGYRERNAAIISQRKRIYREANRDALNQQLREYYAANKDAYSVKNAEWRAQNPEKMAEYSRRYASRHPQRVRDAKRRWKANNPEKVRTYWRNRYALLKAQSKGAHTPEDVLDMLDSQDYLCAYCESPLDDSFHVDHMTPLSRGGSNGWENLAVTCPGCNYSKNRKTAEEYANDVILVQFRGP